VNRVAPTMPREIPLGFRLGNCPGCVPDRPTELRNNPRARGSKPPMPYVLFHNEGLFKRFVIGSPSLWWNNRAILSAEESFAASGKPLPARVFFSVGLLEQRVAPQMPMVTDLRALNYLGPVRPKGESRFPLTRV
jgi:hypothetical protein